MHSWCWTTVAGRRTVRIVALSLRDQRARLPDGRGSPAPRVPPRRPGADRAAARSQASRLSSHPRPPLSAPRRAPRAPRWPPPPAPASPRRAPGGRPPAARSRRRAGGRRSEQREVVWSSIVVPVQLVEHLAAHPERARSRRRWGAARSMKARVSHETPASAGSRGARSSQKWVSAVKCGCACQLEARVLRDEHPQRVGSRSRAASASSSVTLSSPAASQAFSVRFFACARQIRSMLARAQPASTARPGPAPAARADGGRW